MHRRRRLGPSPHLGLFADDALIRRRFAGEQFDLGTALGAAMPLSGLGELDCDLELRVSHLEYIAVP